jgi:DNA (cytosine-5)-methyltransferase 1
MNANYYNEFDPFAAAWLRELICNGHIPFGVVDERDIKDVTPADLAGYTQCHFFAGIGGWSLALQLAGWSKDRPVWTGSPPCQPFSSAGKQKGKDDIRHLWPKFFNLIRECRPSVIFGEQVAAAIGHGWFDDLQTDLEAEGYAAGMVVLPACSVGAFHRRDRLFYVADTFGERHDRHHSLLLGQEPGWDEQDCAETSGCCETDNADNPISERRYEGRDDHSEYDGELSGTTSEIDLVADSTMSEEKRLGSLSIQMEPQQETRRSCDVDPWKASVLIRCSDGKARPVEPTIQPLAHGIPNRVGILRGAGNAIVPQVAAEVIKAYMKC